MQTVSLFSPFLSYIKAPIDFRDSNNSGIPSKKRKKATGKSTKVICKIFFEILLQIAYHYSNVDFLMNYVNEWLERMN